MSSQKKNVDKINVEYWNDFASKTGRFITARQITLYIIIIAAIVQTIGFFITPSNWLIWNALTFIVATNLGAVLLAIHAQKSADDIRDMYNGAFNADFYHTLFLMSNMKNSILEKAERDGKSLEDELGELNEGVYGAFKGYLEAFNEYQKAEVPYVSKKEFQDLDDEELFEG